MVARYCRGRGGVNVVTPPARGCSPIIAQLTATACLPVAIVPRAPNYYVGGVMPGQRQLRLAELLSALSLTTDLGAGMPFEKGLRTCVVASTLASALRLSVDERRAVFHAALLRSVGCTGHAPENAAMFGDDLEFERAFKVLDPADSDTFANRFGDWDPPRQKQHLATLITAAPTIGVYAVRSGCEVSAAL